MLFNPNAPLLFDLKVPFAKARPSPHHNYELAGGLVNAFALGPIGSEDDLWLAALEPPTTGPAAGRPLVCANLLDPFGRRLLVLEFNRPTFNPKGCQVAAGPEGLDVRDPGGRALLTIRTGRSGSEAAAVSYVQGLLKDRTGAVRLETRAAAGRSSLHLHGPLAYGIGADGDVAVDEGLGAEATRRLADLARRAAGHEVG